MLKQTSINSIESKVFPDILSQYARESRLKRQVTLRDIVAGDLDDPSKMRDVMLPRPKSLFSFLRDKSTVIV